MADKLVKAASKAKKKALEGWYRPGSMWFIDSVGNVFDIETHHIVAIMCAPDGESDQSMTVGIVSAGGITIALGSYPPKFAARLSGTIRKYLSCPDYRRDQALSLNGLIDAIKAKADAEPKIVLASDA